MRTVVEDAVEGLVGLFVTPLMRSSICLLQNSRKGKKKLMHFDVKLLIAPNSSQLPVLFSEHARPSTSNGYYLEAMFTRPGIDPI